MDLSLFPLEVLEVLSSFLSTSDLSVCLAACHSWREAFDQDPLWGLHCTDDRLASYLRSEPGQRPPLDLSRYDALPPPCGRRADFMRRAHLLRNWAKGRYSTQELRFETAVLNCTIGLDNEGIHWLVVNLGDRTEIWNVQATPTLHAVAPNISSDPSLLAIADDKLLLVEFSYFARTFHLFHPSLGFSPSGTFCIDSGTSEKDPASEKREMWNRAHSLQKAHHVLYVDNILIGYCSLVNSLTESFLHAWDVKAESKLSEESMVSALGFKAGFGSASVFVSTNQQSGRLICSLYLCEKFISRLVIYCLKHRRFMEFRAISGRVDWCAMSDGFVVASHVFHQLHVYSLGSGALIAKLDWDGGRPTALGAHLALPSRDRVQLVNAWCPQDSLTLRHRSVLRAEAVSPGLLLVCAQPYAAGGAVFLEAWAVRSQERLLDCHVADSDRPAFHSVWPLLSKTAVAVDRSVTLLSFW